LSICCTCVRTTPRSASGLPVVRTIKWQWANIAAASGSTLPAEDLRRSGQSPWLPTTPTPGASLVSCTIAKRFPSGSWPGHTILAMASLITTTGAVFSRSKSVKSRPPNSGMRAVAKWPGITSSKFTSVPRLLGSVCSPSRKIVPAMPPPKTPFADTEAPATPGTFFARWMRSRKNC